MGVGMEVVDGVHVGESREVGRMPEHFMSVR